MINGDVVVEVGMGMGMEAGNDEPLSPTARLFQTPRLNCCIIALLGVKTFIDVPRFKIGLENSLLKHPRFSSLMVMKGGKMRWKRVKVDIEKHVFNSDLDPDMDSPDRFVEDYTSNLTKTSLDLTKPLWEFHLLNVKTSEASAVAILKLHHSMGDGTALISTLLACSRKTSDPNALPSNANNKKRSSSRGLTGFRSFFYTIWSIFVMTFYRLVDAYLMLATLLFLKDSVSPLRTGSKTVDELIPKWLVHRILSLNDVKSVKNAMNTTINDVLLGVTQAGVTRYLNRRYASDQESKEQRARKKKNKNSIIPQRTRLRIAVVINLRKSAGIEALAEMMESEEELKKGKWGNDVGFVLLPFAIASRDDDPLSYVREAKAIMDRKKVSVEAIISRSIGVLILKLFGSKSEAALLHRILFNTTIGFSNVAGPEEEISLYGHPLAYIAPTVYGFPQALIIHWQSYDDKMVASLAVDPDVIPDPHQLCNDLQESLKLIKGATLNTRSN